MHSTIFDQLIPGELCKVGVEIHISSFTTITIWDGGGGHVGRHLVGVSLPLIMNFDFGYLERRMSYGPSER